jgi:hypothetical protein
MEVAMRLVTIRSSRFFFAIAVFFLAAALLHADTPGYGRELRGILKEDFSTPTLMPSPGFAVGEAGRFPKIGEERWIRGASDGSRAYPCYYQTDTDSLPLIGGREYEARFDWRIDTSSSAGFEALFYSPTSGARNEWLPSLVINGKNGAVGTGVLKGKLRAYSDYRVVWNIPRGGKIAIRNITVMDLTDHKIIATESLDTEAPGPGPAFAWEGAIGFSKATAASRANELVIGQFGSFRTKPEVLGFEPNQVVIVEFDWTATRKKVSQWRMGGLSLYAADSPSQVRFGTDLPGYGPLSGHFVGGVRTGEGKRPWVIAITAQEGVQLRLSRLKLSIQEPTPLGATEIPAVRLHEAAFPRLGNYQMQDPIKDSWNGVGTIRSKVPYMSPDEMERRLALYDIVGGLLGADSSDDPALGLRLRALNPNIVLLPYYTMATEVWIEEPIETEMKNPLCSAENQFRKGLDPAWFLRDSQGAPIVDPDWVHIKKLNHSPFCPRDAQGRTYADYFVDRAVPLHLSDGTWDGLFLDNLFARTNPHIAHSSDPAKFDIDWNRNGTRDETILSTHLMTAASTIDMVWRLRDRVGESAFLMANDGALPDRVLTPLVNGFLLELFNVTWYDDWMIEGFSEARWSASFEEYRQIVANCRRPSAVMAEAIGLHPGEFVTPNGDFAAPTANDIHLQRFALGTTLLDDGFFEYDVYEARTPPMLYDEWLVSPEGVSVDDASGKGWLGDALGPCVELLADMRTVKNTAGPLTARGSGRDGLLIDCGSAAAGARQYLVEFDWEIAEDCQSCPMLGVVSNGTWIDMTEINALLKGSSGRYRVHTTVPPRARVAYQFDVNGPGALLIKNVRVRSGRAGLFRRDFQNGLVLVNASDERRELGLKEIAGALARSGVKRILGKLDRATNNGQPVTGPIILGPADAIVLIADRRER